MYDGDGEKKIRITKILLFLKSGPKLPKASQVEADLIQGSKKIKAQPQSFEHGRWNEAQTETIQRGKCHLMINASLNIFSHCLISPL